eukprot:659602-Pyramimonas_sp.AAC.1
MIHVESVYKWVHLYACPEGPKAWRRSMPKSSCTMPSHPLSDRRADTNRPPQNALYFAWANSSGSMADPGEARSPPHRASSPGGQDADGYSSRQGDQMVLTPSWASSRLLQTLRG